MQTLAEWMKTSRALESKGKKLSQISIEMYLKNCLNLEIVEIKEVESLFEDKYEVVATDGTKEYLFDADYYEAEEFVPMQNVLFLKEIRGAEGVFKTDKRFWLKNDNNKDHKFFRDSLEDLMKGTKDDVDLKFAIEYIKKSLSKYENYVYLEKRENDIKTFLITLGDKIEIRMGFQNSILFSFEKHMYTPTDVIFTKKNRVELKEALDNVLQLVHNFIRSEVFLDDYSISQLCDLLRKEKLKPQVNTVALTREFSEAAILIHPIVIGEWDSYHQVELTLYYEQTSKTILVESNYLFKKFVKKCSSVSEVHECVKEVIKMIDEN